MRIRAQGPGAMRPPKEERGPARSRRAARKDEREEERPPPPSLNPASRRKVADALKSIIEAYPFGLLAARVDAMDLDLVLRCPSTDLVLIADLVKQRLMPTLRAAGVRGRFWRKGFLRRALGTQGDVRRALVLLRRDARVQQSELIDRVRHDEHLGVRTRRPDRPIE